LTLARLVIGIIVGIVLSFFSVSFFNLWETYFQFLVYANYDILRAITLLIGSNFEFDIISFFASGTFTINGLFAPQLLAWIFVGFISGTIAKGLKRGVMASLLVVVVDLLIWILMSIISGEDLMSLFQGAHLIATIGGILSALMGGFLGGLAGGYLSGPYEEFY